MDPQLNVEALDSVFASLSDKAREGTESPLPDTEPEAPTVTAEVPPETTIAPTIETIPPGGSVENAAEPLAEPPTEPFSEPPAESAPETAEATAGDGETSEVRRGSAFLGAFKAIFGGGKSKTAESEEAAVESGRDADVSLDSQPDTDGPASPGVETVPVVETQPAIETLPDEPAAVESPQPSPVVETEEAPKGGFFSRLGRSLFGGQKSQPESAPDTDPETRVAGADGEISGAYTAPKPEPEPAFKSVTRADGEQVVILEGPPGQPAAPSQPSDVLGGEGSKIRALLAGEEVQPLQPNVVTAAGAQATTSPVPAAPPAAETLTAAASSPGAAAVTEASVAPDQVQAALASGAAASARPPAETLAALTSPLPAPAAPVEPVANIDVNADDNVSSAIVLVVTPTGTGSGVLLDNAGHVLANWHVVTGYPTVSVSFKTPDEGVPSAERTRSARVVRLNKSADLALLRIDDVPVDVTPVHFADVNQIRVGGVLHVIGHPADGSWSHTLGKISKVKPGSSWYAGRHLLHRGTVIQAKVLDDPGSAGAPLFNNRLELVGISAVRKTKQGVLIGVSVDTILRFLEASPAQAAIPAGG